MTSHGDLERARVSITERRWADAYAALAAVADLGAVDLEALALAAHMTGHDADCESAWERAHHAHLAEGDAEAAARCAWWLGFGLMPGADMARAMGWFARAERVLDDAGLHDSVVRGYLMAPRAVATMFGGDPGSARPMFLEAAAVADRFGEANLATLCRLGLGQCLVSLGETAAGVALLDEAMVAATTDAVAPQIVGLVYCAVVVTCQGLFDIRRAQEWTAALTRWCDAQQGLVPYRGQCLVHRSELLQLHGSWPDALDEALRARDRLSEPPGQPAAGMALYQLGELHRLRGNVADAEEAYREASKYGHDPQPGLALLRVAQGQLDAAVVAIERAVAEPAEPLSRPRLLAAAVEIALAANDATTARTHAEDLAAIAAGSGAALLSALALRCEGAVLLSDGRPHDALGVLRRAWSAWQDIGVPYESARVRVLIGLACRAVGDEEAAEMELDAARWVFEQLGAAHDLTVITGLTRRAPAATPGGLTLRELQVLQLVATGKTNRSIAGDLFLSEKTVARHVANIFTKLDVNSRAAATAYAYEHDLV